MPCLLGMGDGFKEKSENHSLLRMDTLGYVALYAMSIVRVNTTIAQTAVQEWMVRVMSDYIKREDATEVYSKLYWMHEGLLNFQEELGKVYDEILGIPSADAAPVRHGRWYKNDQDKLLMRIRCSICNKAIYSENHFAYCPNCGARMDGEEE